MQDGADYTLTDVIACLPANCYERDAWKSAVPMARDLATYAGVSIALVLVDSPWLLVPLWVLAALSVSALFILAHDAAHGALYENPRANRVLGRIAMLPSLHLYDAWVFGHNRIHHGHTARQHMDYSWHPLTPEQYCALSRIGKLGHRLKWSCFGAGVYYLHEVWWKHMICFRPPAKIASAVRRDRIVVGGWAAGVFLALLMAGWSSYGTLAGGLWMWIKVFAVPFLLFGWVIGWTTYVHHVGPDVAWHARRRWTKLKGPMHGTTTVYVSRWLNFFLHNIFLHVPHHIDARIPWYKLPAASDAILERFGDRVGARVYRLRDYLRSTRVCRLYDFEREAWTGYGAVASGEPSTGRVGFAHLIQYQGMRLASALAQQIPRAWLQGLAAGIARVVFALGGRRVRWTLSNLKIAFPELSEAERGAIGRRSFVNFAWALLDVLFMDRWTERELLERVHILGREHLDDALAAGKGAILLGCHIGSFELGAPAAPALAGTPVAWVSRPMKNPLVQRRFTDLMTRTGCTLIEPRGAALPERPVRAALARDLRAVLRCALLDLARGGDPGAPLRGAGVADLHDAARSRPSHGHGRATDPVREHRRSQA
ncbi:MAG: fatty acid desaturase [Deltaproteobacteria bacterium]|nr:fatty acid desaturase [Deltaproteobacteria bacterium]